MNVKLTKGLAGYVHKRLRAEPGFGRDEARGMHEVLQQGYRGARCSFDYPACPNLVDQDEILALPDAARLGDGDPRWPEESTRAIVAHHPQATHFTG